MSSIASADNADELLRAALRGEAPDWPGGDVIHGCIVERATLHGVHGLLQGRATAAWPEPIRERIHAEAIGQAMWELRHQHLLANLLAALAHRGIEPLLIKGTALAYSLYEDPAQRARGDTDLLVAPADREGTAAILQCQGFTRLANAAGDTTAYQATYTREEPGGQLHAIDLHWKINNSELLSRLFTYAELRRRAAPLPLLSPHALGPCEVDAMLVACMHRATHRHNPYYVQGEPHHEPDRLAWLYDIHLLACRFEDMQWRECIALAAAKGLRRAVSEGLARAREAFATSWPPWVDRALSAPGESELASDYLSASAVRQHWMDFRTLPDDASRFRWMRERCFPPADYMRRKYAGARFKWLPWLYLRRASGGLLKRAGMIRG